MMNSKSIVWASFICQACSVLQLLGAEAGPDLAKLRLVPTSEALAQFARSNQIPLERIEPCVEGRTLNVGDSITGVVTLFEKEGKRTQWLLFLEASAPDAKEAAAKPPKPLVWYSALGGKLEFIPSPAWVNLRTVGPVSVSPVARAPKLKDCRDRFALDQAALGLGMERGAAALTRLAPADLKILFNLREKPFSEAEIQENRKALSSPQLAQEEQRALVGAIPAMLSYFSIVRHTRGLEDLFYQMIDRPSLWSMLRHGIRVSLGFQPEAVRPADATAWGLPTGTPTFFLPMVVEVNDKVVLLLTLVVTTPRPPLLACGGVVGVLAEKPSDPQHYLTLRLVNAHQAGH